MGLSWWFSRNTDSTKTWGGFSLTGLLIVLGFFGFGYAMRPVQQIFDDLHDSEDDSSSDSENENESKS